MGERRSPIHVETLIRAPLERVWDRTQDPAAHERWDVRFTSINHLSKEDGSEAQRFQYATRLGPGLAIAGEGESVTSEEERTEGRNSALRFRSDDRRSLMREGSGYWRYVPTPEGTRFVTWFDYGTRWGSFGERLDRAIFRPLIGWATAWSFDRLRLWIESGVDPADALRHALVHTVARLALALVFLWHAFTAILSALALPGTAAVPANTQFAVLAGLSFGELIFAIALLGAWRQRWPVVAALVALAAATVAAFVELTAAQLTAASTPLPLFAALAALATVDLLVIGRTPFASRCLREPPLPQRTEISSEGPSAT